MVLNTIKAAIMVAVATTGFDGRPVLIRRNCGLGCGVSVYQPPVAIVQQPLATWQYSVGANQLGEERLRKVEEAIIVQQQLNAQLTRIVSGGAGNVSQSEVAVRRVFQQNCLKCHNGAGAKGGMDLTNPSFNVFDKALISQMVASGQMPPQNSGIKLSKADEEVIQTWAGESADEFRQELRRLRQGGNGGGPPAMAPPRPAPNGNGVQ